MTVWFTAGEVGDIVKAAFGAGTGLGGAGTGGGGVTPQDWDVMARKARAIIAVREIDIKVFFIKILLSFVLIDTSFDNIKLLFMGLLLSVVVFFILKFKIHHFQRHCPYRLYRLKATVRDRSACPIGLALTVPLIYIHSHSRPV